MPKFLFDIKDTSENSTTASTQTSQTQHFEITDAGSWNMKFDKDATDDIDQIMKLMSHVENREDVVTTALQILGLAINRDLVIEGKHKGDPKRISGLWRQ